MINMVNKLYSYRFFIEKEGIHEIVLIYIYF